VEVIILTFMIAIEMGTIISNILQVEKMLIFGNMFTTGWAITT